MQGIVGQFAQDCPQWRAVDKGLTVAKDNRVQRVQRGRRTNPEPFADDGKTRLPSDSVQHLDEILQRRGGKVISAGPTKRDSLPTQEDGRSVGSQVSLQAVGHQGGKRSARVATRRDNDIQRGDQLFGFKVAQNGNVRPSCGGVGQGWKCLSMRSLVLLADTTAGVPRHRNREDRLPRPGGLDAANLTMSPPQSSDASETSHAVLPRSPNRATGFAEELTMQRSKALPLNGADVPSTATLRSRPACR